MLKIKHILQMMSVALFATCFYACEKVEHDAEVFADSRTVLMYIAADANGLSGEAGAKMDVVLSGWKPQYGRLLFFVDRGEGSPALLEAQLRNNKNVNDTLKVYKLQNSASAQLFAEVLADIKHFAPSKSYGMMFFSHATGWLPQGAFLNPTAVNHRNRSIGSDGAAEMELRDFAAVIDDGFFEFMIFECCLMSGVEVAYELRNKSKYIVASAAEIVRPGFYSLYSQFVPLIYKPTADLMQVAKLYHDHTLTLEGAFRSSTISVIDCSGLERLATTCAQIIHSSKVDINLSTIQFFDRNINKLFFDLGDYIAQLSTPAQKLAFDDAMRGCILYKANTEQFMIGYNGFGIKSHCGLTTYIKQGHLMGLNASYETLQWADRINKISEL